MAWTLFIAATVLLALGVPVAFSLAAAALLAVAIDDRYTAIVVLKEMFTGIDSFPLLAVPFFILAAELMTGGKLTEVLLRFASQFVGHRRGGLGHANVLSLTFFSGISGSALADAAGPGSMMIKMMDKAGYSKAYAAALTASTAVVGPIIPPSIIMIIYALQDERVSAGALFMAGLLPGLLIAVAMMIVNQIISTRRHYRANALRPSAREMARNTVNAVPALLLPVIILGGIRAGIFTPTEASVVAVVYALLCGAFIYRSLHWKNVPTILSRSAILTASVLLIVAASAAFAWVLTIENVPQSLARWITSLDVGPLDVAAADQRAAADLRHLHRATAWSDGAGADPGTGRARRRHRSGAFRDDRDLQPDARDDHAASRRAARSDFCSVKGADRRAGA